MELYFSRFLAGIGIYILYFHYLGNILNDLYDSIELVNLHDVY